MEHKTMLKLKTQLAEEGTVVRYKDCVVAAEFFAAPAGEWFEVEVYSPVETEDETGEDFWNLRLENISEWENEHFTTEGEALMAGFQFIDQLERGGF